MALQKFWDKLIEGLASRWVASLLLPALVYWGSGAVFYAWRIGLPAAQAWLDTIALTEGVALAVAGLLGLAGSGWLVQQATTPALRLAEGYWPGPLRALRFARARRLAEEKQRMQERWNKLAERYQNDRAGMTLEEMDEYARLDARLVMTCPRKANLFMPTRLGNVLRTAEEYPQVRYGLEIRLTFPRLWLLLPKNMRAELSTARLALDERTRLLVWAALYLLWAPLNLWALPVAVVLGAIAYGGMYAAAGVYGELLCSAYDLYRFELYRALHLALPARAGDEEAAGQALTLFLHRGQSPDTDWRHHS